LVGEFADFRLHERSGNGATESVITRKIREDKNLTQQKLADKVGLHLSYIGNIEIGAKRPSLETLFRIAEELGVKVSDLFRF
jgi:transcriptional regulator with XRE-family HTH domain